MTGRGRDLADIWFGRGGIVRGHWAKDAEDGAARKRKRPQRRSMDVVKEDMKEVGVTEEVAGVIWRQIICCGNSRGGGRRRNVIAV